MFTCIECEYHYDHLTGDVNERMCYECIDKEEEDGDEFLAENLIEEETTYSCRPCGESYWKESKDRLKEILNQTTGIA